MNPNRPAFVMALFVAAPLAKAADFLDFPAFSSTFPEALHETFDTVPAGAEFQVAPCLGIEFEDPGAGFPEVVAGQGSVPSSPPNSLANRPVGTNSTQPIRFSRVDGALILAVGVANPTSDDGLVLSILDAAGATLESIAIPPQPAPQFRGISSSVPGTTVEVRWDGATGNGLHGIDDILLVLADVGVPDVDGDGVEDGLDNCTLVPNGDQTDIDGDGFGNLCDADYNNDCQVDFVDLGRLRLAFFGSDPVVDLNSDGVINVVDLGLIRNLFFEAPGPSCQAVCN